MLRDHEGAFRGGACQFFPDSSDPELMEIRACEMGVKLAVERQVQRVHVELDSVAVVSMLNDQTKNLSTAGPIIERIKELLRSTREFKVSWARRSANGVAHLLAKVSWVSHELSRVWPHEPPDCILQFVSDDIPSYT